MALLFPGTDTTAATPTAPIGVKAATPTANLTPTKTTLTPSQTAPVDLSSKYANVGGTIYNTQTQQKFSNPTDFFKDSGQTSFNNLKFKTDYTPTGSESIYGATPAPAPTPTTLPQLATANAGVSGLVDPGAPAANSANANNSPFYTPPNQGTTGVSQGGLIGNLNTNATTNPRYDAALAKVNGVSQEQSDLETEAAKQDSFIKGSPFGLSEQLGQQGILQQLVASKRAALTPKYNAAIAELQGANTAQSNTTSGLSAAASANAPITNPQTGGLVTPSSNTTTQQTTSGAQNISSLIGVGNGSNGHPQGEYFNTQTNTGFSSPQQLADFINQQMPGTNATAANVFQQLNTLGSSQQVKPTDPYYQTLQTFASAMANNQMGLVPYNSLPPTIQAQLTTMAQGINPSFNINTALGAGAALQSNTSAAQTAAVNAANSAYSQYYKDYLDTKATVDNVDSFGSLLTNGMVDAQGNVINPSDVKYANMALSTIRGALASQQQAQFDTTFAALKSKVSGLLAVGGNETPTQLTADANSILSGNAPLGTLQATLDRIKQEGQAVLNIAAQKGNTALQQVQGGGSTSGSTPTGSFTNGQTAAGGSLIFQNGVWVVK